MGERLDLATDILIMAARNYVLSHQLAGDLAQTASGAKVREAIEGLTDLLAV